jgi:hypothetical protein
VPFPFRAMRREALTFDGTKGANLIVTRYCFNFLHLQELSGEKKFVGLRLLHDLKYPGDELVIRI